MIEPSCWDVVANRLEDNPKTSWLQVPAVWFPHWARPGYLTPNQLNAGSCFSKAMEFADTFFWLLRGVGEPPAGAVTFITGISMSPTLA